MVDDPLAGLMDGLIEMTKEADAACRLVGCAPTCHACRKPIVVGSKFGMSSRTNIFRQNKRAMVCSSCFLIGREPPREEFEKRSGAGGAGCFFDDLGRIIE